MPSASQSSCTIDAGRVGGHHRVRVALDALGVDIGHRHVEIRGRRRHGAEHLATVDSPAALGSGRQVVPGRVMSWPRSLIAAASTTPSRTICSSDRRSPGTTLLTGRDGHLATALHVEHCDQVHVHADRDGGVSARQAARSDDQVVRRRDAEPAVLHGDRAPRNSRRTSAPRSPRTGSCRRGRARPRGWRTPRRASRPVDETDAGSVGQQLNRHGFSLGRGGRPSAPAACTVVVVIPPRRRVRRS